jgi:ABC-2 type transport system permease protein
VHLAKYLKVFEIGLQNTFVYRWNFLLRSVLGMVPLVGMFYLWGSIFEARGTKISGYDESGMLFYFLMTILIDNWVAPTEDEWQIAAEIREGQMSALLTKPLHYLSYRLSLYSGYRLLYAAVTAVPLGLLCYFMRADIRLPASGMTWLAFAVSLAMAGLIQFFMAYSVAMLAFWFLEISTLIWIAFTLKHFLSGMVFPLDLLPMPLQQILYWSPFPYEIFFPAQVFLERLEGRALWEGLAAQAVWLGLSWLMATALFTRGIRRYQAVGG